MKINKEKMTCEVKDVTTDELNFLIEKQHREEFRLAILESWPNGKTGEPYYNILLMFDYYVDPASALKEYQDEYESQKRLTND